MQEILLGFAFFFLARRDSDGAAAPPRPNGRLTSAIVRALAQNPDLRAMEAKIRAARARVPQPGALPDPEIEVGVRDVPTSDLSLSRSDFTMETATVRQSFPGFGKRGARKASAEASFENAVAIHGSSAATLAAEVADSFFTLAGLDRRRDILERSRDRLKRAAASAAERYRVGRGAQSDVLRANLETTGLEDRLLALRAERRAEAARFDALQDLPTDTPVEPVDATLPAVPGRSAAEILSEAENASPEIAAARALVRRAEEELKLADLERRPDWTVSAYYARREKFEDLAGASVSLSLPLAHPRRLDQRRAEMEAELSAANADLEAVRNDLRRGIESAGAEVDRNVEEEKLYRTTILPQAETTFRSAEEGYAVGQIDFLTLERAALDLDAYEAEVAARVSGIGRAVAALQKASGLPLIEGTPGFGENHVEK